jgi:hypothetical protein
VRVKNGASSLHLIVDHPGSSTKGVWRCLEDVLFASEGSRHNEKDGLLTLPTPIDASDSNCMSSIFHLAKQLLYIIGDSISNYIDFRLRNAG